MDYKEILTNQLIVFANENINNDHIKKEKVETLNEENKKRFTKKIVDYIISKASGLALIQGLQYVGVRDKQVNDWVNEFFSDFDKNMEEKKVAPKMLKPKQKTTKTETYKTSEGLFGLEVTVGKTILTKSEFEEKFKDKDIEWKENEVLLKEKEKDEEVDNDEEIEDDNEEIEEEDEEDDL